MNLLSKEILFLRAKFLSCIRSFFEKRGFLEIDTPKLKKVPGMEPYLDPFLVHLPSGEKSGYLVTSPEYSLKQALSMGLEKIYEIGQVYRSGEKGNLHTSEFLMLEFYQSGIDEQKLIDLCIDLLDYLENHFHSCGFSRSTCQKISMEDLFKTKIGIHWDRESLISYIEKNFPDTEDLLNWRYDDLFFLVFLNHIEPNLGKDPLFVFDYPPELASLAKIEKNRAKRFEIYWNGVELGNAFYELNDVSVQVSRFREEQSLRKELGKEIFPLDDNFISALERGLPDCSGIAMGLDRLFMIFLGHKDLRFISPYYRGENEKI